MSHIDHHDYLHEGISPIHDINFQEMYNNIVIYIVGHPPEESPSPNEMHIFQCVNVSAR